MKTTKNGTRATATKARKPIQRRATALPKRRRRIRSVSANRRRQMDQYRRAANGWKIGKSCAHPDCVKPCEDVHHSRGRVGKLLMETDYWVPVCRAHHRWIGDNPAEARRLGLLCEVGRWNTGGGR